MQDQANRRGRGGWIIVGAVALGSLFILVYFGDLAARSKRVYEIRPLIATAVQDVMRAADAAPQSASFPVRNPNVGGAERQADGSIRFVLTGAPEIEGKTVALARETGKLGAWKCKVAELAPRYLPRQCN